MAREVKAPHPLMMVPPSPDGTISVETKASVLSASSLDHLRDTHSMQRWQHGGFHPFSFSEPQTSIHTCVSRLLLVCSVSRPCCGMDREVNVSHGLLMPPDVSRAHCICLYVIVGAVRGKVGHPHHAEPNVGASKRGRLRPFLKRLTSIRKCG